VKLLFTESVSTGTPLDLGNLELQLLQNRPNPFSDATTIGFILPEACEAHIRILDISGRELTSYDRQYTAGYHELEFNMENAWIVWNVVLRTRDTTGQTDDQDGDGEVSSFKSRVSKFQVALGRPWNLPLDTGGLKLVLITYYE
jgi:hypothetical protein